MRIPIARRGGSSDPKSNPIFITLGISVALLFIAISVYVYVAKKNAAKYIPPSAKKSRWRALDPRSSKLGKLFRLKRSSTSNRNDNQETSYTPSTHTADPALSVHEMSASSNVVNRNTSIRSIMTLPPYHPSPHPNERLIAREGERAGVDTVIEFPETADEEEARRDQDMEALFQIRQARRQQVNERSERRQQRQEARQQCDWARLEQLRLDSQRRARARADSTGSAGSSTTSLPNAASLTAEHASRTAGRDRRVSSVSYADIGLARHDGSRLRADSVESDHRPLLDSAASIGGADRNTSSRRSSLFQTQTFTHNRAASVESVLTTESDLAAELTPQTSAGHRSGSVSDPTVLTPSASGQDTGSEPSPPMGEPPRYDDGDYGDDDVPPYASPVRDRGEGVPRLPSVRVDSRLPAIEITGSTPVVGSGVSPTERM